MNYKVGYKFFIVQLPSFIQPNNKNGPHPLQKPRPKEEIRLKKLRPDELQGRGHRAPDGWRPCASLRPRRDEPFVDYVSALGWRKHPALHRPGHAPHAAHAQRMPGSRLQVL